MIQELITLKGKTANGYVVDLGPVKLVYAITDTGLVGCGAIDVLALDRFNYPAARISGVASLDDLLNGKIKEANEHARQRGIEPGQTGRQALERL
jgi:uncharacterized protein YunC (DUF1805 family)